MARYRLSTWPTLAAMLGALLLGLGICQMSFGQAVLKRIGVGGNQSGYTSISFQYPQSLPTALREVRTTLKVDFKINNETTTTNIYRWTLHLLQGTDNRDIATGDARIAPGQTMLMARAVVIYCDKGRVRITAALARPSEHIDAWMTCKA